MKKLLVLSALVASVATGASAMVNNDVNLNEIQRYAPNADVSTLSDGEINTLLNLIHSGDSESEKGQGVRSFFLSRS